MGQVWAGVVVDTEPGVVNNHSEPSVVLDLDSHQGQVQILVEGTNLVQGEHHPEASLDEICILVLEEVVLVQVGRWVQSPLGTAGAQFISPQQVVHFDLHALVSDGL